MIPPFATPPAANTAAATPEGVAALRAVMAAEISSKLALRGDERVLEIDGTRGALHSDEWSAYDVTIGRFGIQQNENPAAYVETLVGATKPGGRVAFVDETESPMRPVPEVEGFEELWQAYRDATPGSANQRETEIHYLLQEAGARPSRFATVLSACRAGDARFAQLSEALIDSLRTALPWLLARGSIDRAQGLATLDALECWRRRQDAVLCCAAQIVEARRRVGIIAMTP